MVWAWGTPPTESRLCQCSKDLWTKGEELGSEWSPLRWPNEVGPYLVGANADICSQGQILAVSVGCSASPKTTGFADHWKGDMNGSARNAPKTPGGVHHPSFLVCDVLASMSSMIWLPTDIRYSFFRPASTTLPLTKILVNIREAEKWPRKRGHRRTLRVLRVSATIMMSKPVRTKSSQVVLAAAIVVAGLLVAAAIIVSAGRTATTTVTAVAITTTIIRR